VGQPHHGDPLVWRLSALEPTAGAISRSIPTISTTPVLAALHLDRRLEMPVDVLSVSAQRLPREAGFRSVEVPVVVMISALPKRAFDEFDSFGGGLAKHSREAGSSLAVKSGSVANCFCLRSDGRHDRPGGNLMSLW
jgi:hypothetical protein